MKKLTPTQKKILHTLKDNPAAVLHHGWLGGGWHLIVNGERQTVRTDLVDERIRPFLKKLPYRKNSAEDYTILPDAEITDEWLQAAIEAQYQEREAKRQAEEEAKEQARQELASRIASLGSELEASGFEVTYSGSYAYIHFGDKSYRIEEIADK